MNVAIDANVDRQAAVDRALGSFAEYYDALTALRLESCIHCGMCADACHFFIATEDPRYTPILKVEPLKQAYKRECGPFAPVFSLLGLKKKVSMEELEEWQELVYGSCTMCGRCSLICPMGIDIAAAIEHTRRGMFEAGLAPEPLYSRARRQASDSRLEDEGFDYHERLEKIAAEHGLSISVDKDQAEVMVCVTQLDLERNPAAVVALIRVLDHTGADYTFRTDGLIAENYGYLVGGLGWQRKIAGRLIAAATACGAKTVIVPECGHGYTALRWEAADLQDAPLPFKVRHIAEYMAEALERGSLKLAKRNGATVTFHDPCQVVRKGGAGEAPRKLLEAMGIPLKELKNHRGFTFCCGGGGGVIELESSNRLRRRWLQDKLREIDATGADELVVTCSGCRQSFRDACEHLDWNKQPHSLVEMVSDRLQENSGAES